MGKKPKSASKVSKPSKGKIPTKPTDFFNKNKGVQCRAYKSYGHIQFKCANNLKKKKAMITSWSNGDSKRSQNKEEDQINNITLVGFLSSNLYLCV